MGSGVGVQGLEPPLDPPLDKLDLKFTRSRGDQLV